MEDVIDPTDVSWMESNNRDDDDEFEMDIVSTKPTGRKTEVLGDVEVCALPLI